MVGSCRQIRATSVTVGPDNSDDATVVVVRVGVNEALVVRTLFLLLGVQFWFASFDASLDGDLFDSGAVSFGLGLLE